MRDIPLNITKQDMVKINQKTGNLNIMEVNRHNETFIILLRAVTFGNKVAYKRAKIEWSAPYNGPPTFPSKIPSISLTIKQEEQLAGLPVYKYTSPVATDVEGDQIFMNFTDNFVS